MWLGGCALVRTTGSGAPGASLEGVEVGPFAPASLRVHPLTHLERDPDRGVYLLVHVQLRDRWSDICKGVGVMHLALFQQTGLGGSGQEEQLLQWQVDLSDLEKNAVFFDPATQTYRFSLSGLPDWVKAMAPGTEGDQASSGRGKFRVQARLTTVTPEGTETVLVGELVVER
ncbi:MAG: hypothetical protein DYG94_09740 [Leptolyngbya sp. PLA3]|nr:MAG: hypothetical protein EDM82_07955 [Cyanobacteria bacterium CYA]MCE7969011.1 hypothetical protein [Leptolyngbya sp. PL-A3]